MLAGGAPNGKAFGGGCCAALGGRYAAGCGGSKPDCEGIAASGDGPGNGMVGKLMPATGGGGAPPGCEASAAGCQDPGNGAMGGLIPAAGCTSPAPCAGEMPGAPKGLCCGRSPAVGAGGMLGSEPAGCQEPKSRSPAVGADPKGFCCGCDPSCAGGMLGASKGLC